MDNGLKIIETVNAYINGFIWSPFMLAVLLGTGLYFSLGTGFMQIFKLKSVLRETVIKTFKSRAPKADKSGITPFQALSTALAGTIGTGNIAGVATAITIAGPGAIFWMWISALLGMMTKYAEIVLAVTYRRKNARGEWVGGPMIFIQDGLGAGWLAYVYAFLGIAASFGVGNMAQANSISAAMEDAFHFSPLSTGLVVSALVGITVAGGVKKIASLTEKVVPIMSLFYILSAIFVIAVHFKQIPHAFSMIIHYAFQPAAPIGGFAGAAVATAFQKGISRGIFTNEAGLGSASIAHAAANTDHPARQGLWGIFEVFFDTIVMCTITALAILATGAWSGGLSGSALTIAAFDTAMNDFGKYVIAVSLAFFAFSSMLAWSYYGRKCIEFLTGGKYSKAYLCCFLTAIVLGSVAELHLVWEISDALNGLMAIPNLIGLLGLSGVVFQATRDGIKKIKL